MVNFVTGRCLLGFAALQLLILGGQAAGCGRRVCYYDLRTGPEALRPALLPAAMCTHVVLAHVGLQTDDITQLTRLTPANQTDRDMYLEVAALKRAQPGLKTLVALGGAEASPDSLSVALRSTASRLVLAKDVRAFLQAHDLDGISLDVTPLPEDKDNFVQLLKDLQRSWPRPVVAAAVPTRAEDTQAAYAVQEMGGLLDFITLRTHDFKPHTGKTGHHSALFPSHTQPGDSVVEAASLWTGLGAPRDRLVIAVPLFARVTQLTSSSRGLGAPAKHFKHRTHTHMPYNQICESFPGEEAVYDAEIKSAYKVLYATLWVSYENQKSLQEKVDFVKDRGYGGVAGLDLSLDDVSGECGQGAFPLWSAVNRQC